MALAAESQSRLDEAPAPSGRRFLPRLSGGPLCRLVTFYEKRDAY